MVVFLVGFFQPQFSHCKYPIIIYRWWFQFNWNMLLSGQIGSSPPAVNMKRVWWKRIMEHLECMKRLRKAIFKPFIPESCSFLYKMGVSPITLQIILCRLLIVRERVDFDQPHFFPPKNCTGYSSMTDWAPREIVVFSLGPVRRAFFLFPPGGYDAEAGGGSAANSRVTFGICVCHLSWAWESWDS